MNNQQGFDLRPVSVLRALWADHIDLEPQNEMLEPLYVIWEASADVTGYIAVGRE